MMRDLLLRRTAEGLNRARESAASLMQIWCERWGVDIENVLCQTKDDTNIGGITLEQLGERIKTATRPVVVVAVDATATPAKNLMEDWKMVLKSYEGQYDLYLVLDVVGQNNNTLHNYFEAFRFQPEQMMVPSVLFVYNGYGAYEVRVGYGRSEQQKFIAWFDQMMKKAAF